MTLKKIAAFAGSAALLLGAATPALAYSRHHDSDPLLDVSVNRAVVVNTAVAQADTGLNVQRNTANGGQGDVDVERSYNTMTTGAAQADATAVALTNIRFGGCGCESDAKISVNWNDAIVQNGAQAGAFTGGNTQVNRANGGSGLEVLSEGRHHRSGGDVEVEESYNSLATGGATADADAWAVTNAHLTGFAL